MNNKNIPWGSIRSILLDKSSFSNIKKIIGYTQIDITKLSHLEQRQLPQKSASKSELLSGVDSLYSSLSREEQNKFCSICCEEILRIYPEISEKLSSVLSRVGWKIYNNKIIPIEILEELDTSKIPSSSKEDVTKIFTRLRDNDLSGALTSICAAIDSATTEIYKNFSSGSPNSASFQEGIMTSLKYLKLEEKLKKNLRNVDWNDDDIQKYIKNLKGSINQHSFLLQQLRSLMADVHGTKAAIHTEIENGIHFGIHILKYLYAYQ